jgi:hypothetical protein
MSTAPTAPTASIVRAPMAIISAPPRRGDAVETLLVTKPRSVVPGGHGPPLPGCGSLIGPGVAMGCAAHPLLGGLDTIGHPELGALDTGPAAGHPPLGALDICAGQPPAGLDICADAG